MMWYISHISQFDLSLCVFLQSLAVVKVFTIFCTCLQILEALGLGPNGPPIAEPALFQVHPFPLKRMKLTDQDHFKFIATSPDDPYVLHRYKSMYEEQHM